MNEIRDFITYYKIVKNVSKNTLLAYEGDIKEFVFYITDTNYKEMKKQDIYDYIAWLESKGTCPSSRSRKISSIKMFFKWLLDNGYIEKNIAETIEKPKLQKTKPISFKSDEAKNIMKTAKETKGTKLSSVRNLLILALFLNCGFRKFELCNIEISNIDFQEGSIKILGKGGKERVVYFNDGVKILINDYITNARKESNYAEESPFLFVSQKSEKITERQVSRIVDEILEKNGLKKEGVSVHTLRKTCATLLYDNQVDLGVIKELLGHSNMDTTMIYVGIQNEKLKNAGNLILN